MGRMVAEKVNMKRPVAFACLFVVLLAKVASAQAPPAMGEAFELSQPQWKLFVPSGYEHRQDGAVDLLIHFHGDPQTVWNNAAQARLNAIIVTANYNGLSSAYSKPFSDTELFRSLLDDARAKLRKLPDFGEAAFDRIAVTSFSAGYGAVREILKQPHYREAIDAILAADSLYASTDAADGTPVDEQMADYKTYADMATRGEKTFLFTHSDVATPTYESTRETGDELLAHLGLTPTAIDQPGLGTLRFTRTAERGGFVLWGAAGETGDDHMAHLRYLAEWLDDLPLAKRAE
ncbi:hypothetical protein K2D_00990 [Planctomycetes bacterium K2D]|nr:hypothetical protein K2D_00990 [Planctomycetes bacterium K2D]